MNYDWNFVVFLPYVRSFFFAIITTIELSFLASAAGTILGFLLAFQLRSKWFGGVSRFINDVFRAIPMLVLMFAFYYFPYQIFGIEAPSAFIAAVAALTLAQMNFTAEIVRSGIEGVDNSIIEAGKALGFKNGTIWSQIILPDVVRKILPTMMAFFITNIKLSSLAAVIGVEEVVFVAQIAVGQTFRSLEAWVIVAGIYVVLVLPMTFAASRIEKMEWMKRRS